MRLAPIFYILEAFLRSLPQIAQWDTFIRQTSPESLGVFSTHFLHSSRWVPLVKGGARRVIAGMFRFFCLWEIQSLPALRLTTRKHSFRKLTAIAIRPISSGLILVF